MLSDINQNALTFRSASSFVEANATTLSTAKSLGLSGFFLEDILINLRTFDSHSLVFYAYDYHNNFVQLHIEDASETIASSMKQVVYNILVVTEGP